MSTAPCLISAFEGDSRTGLGHRAEATLTCIGFASDVPDVEFVWTPLQKRHAHGLIPDIFNRHFGFGSGAFRVLAPPLIAVPRSPTPPLASGGGVSGGACARWDADGTWDMRLAASTTASPCARDGTSVYSADNCWAAFWCRVAWPGVSQPTRAVSWYAKALPKVRAAYFESSPKGAGSAARGAMAPIVVAVHYRSVQRRRMSNSFYTEVVRSLMDRHRAWASAHAGRARSLRIDFHGDQDVAKSGLLQRFLAEQQSASNSNSSHGSSSGGAGRHGIELRVRSEKADSLSFNATLDVFHDLVEADVLVPSHSSFSIAAALLGNATVLLPECDPRAPGLPHWHVIPCKGLIDLAKVPWPPPRRWRSAGRRGTAARGQALRP